LEEKPVDAGTVQRHFDALAADYDRIKRKNRYYYDLLQKSIAATIPPGRRVLEIGTATGEILRMLSPSLGVGIDLSAGMIEIARRKYPQYRFEACSFETFEPRAGEAFDFIVLSDVIEHVASHESLFLHLKRLCAPGTRVVLTMANPRWEPLLELLEKWNLKMEEGPHNRISESEVRGLARSHGLRVESFDRSALLPVRVPLVSAFLNSAVAPLPVFNSLALISKFTLSSEA